MPKTVQIDQRSHLAPDELEQRLRETTRWSLTPHQGSPFGGRSRLRGRVGRDRLVLGLAQRDLWTLLQPTFRGRIEPTADGGSRLVGDLGVPPWVVWQLRIAFLFVLPLGIFAAAWPLVQELGTTGWIGAAGFGLVGILLTMFGIGMQLAHADKLLPQTEGVLAALTETPPPPQGQAAPASEVQSPVARRAGAARQRQSEGS